MQKKRNGAIDFWRFVFSICIVLCHVIYLNSYGKWIEEGKFWFAGFYIGVEYFFLVSGFLMAKSANKSEGINGYVQFILNKLRGFYPDYLFAFCLSILVMNLAKGPYIFVFPDNLYDLALMQMFGLGGTNFIVGGSWYLSAMLISMAILFPVLCNKNKFEIFLRCGAPLVSLFLLGWLYRQEGTLAIAAQWNGFFAKGILRAIAELCLGCVAYDVVNILKKI